MTKPDEETGLPIVGQPAAKTSPIDPKLLPELRKLEAARERTRMDANQVGYNLVMLIGTAAAVGQTAYVNEKAWLDMVWKIGALNGIPKEQITGTDLEKGVLTLR